MSAVYKVSVDTYFDASHQLTLSSGTSEPLHQHRWEVTVSLSSLALNEIGIVIDFNRLKKKVDSITSDISGEKMGGNQFFRENNCSAENVARYIYERLEAMLDNNLKLETVCVTEEPGCRAEFSR
jgi:6-pyruvoyltetrahydropterin/6-carboxytetrahydropterin synthase